MEKRERDNEQELEQDLKKIKEEMELLKACDDLLKRVKGLRVNKR